MNYPDFKKFSLYDETISTTSTTTSSQVKEMTHEEIYNILRNTFHSQSGLFLSRKQCYEVAEFILNKVK